MENSTVVKKICQCTLDANFLKTLELEKQRNDEATDATWILTSAFIIFTMQSGFGLLEAGLVSPKNECNIMIKNVIDVMFGGMCFWLVGFGLSFGEGDYSNPFCGMGYFLMGSSASHENEKGDLYSKYFFQLSFATTATTIVSGAMCERSKIESYMLYSFLNILVYVFPVHWVWADIGFLKKLGVIDNAGCSTVHIVGGVSSLVATYMLKPRHGKFEKDENKAIEHEMASPTNMMLGTFMLWWGWLGINCGSTFGISGTKWKQASKAAVATINASISGGIFSVLYSKKLTNRYNKKLDVKVLMIGILGGLVSITGINSICQPWEAVLIGFIGGAVSCYGRTIIEHCEIDDPVCCIPVHGIAGLWGMISVGLFADKTSNKSHKNYYGLLKGGGFKLLGIQLLASLCIAAWAAVGTLLLMLICNRAFGFRVDLENEILGADYMEHGIKRKDLFCELKEDLDYVLENMSQNSLKNIVTSSTCNVSHHQSYLSLTSKHSICINDSNVVKEGLESNIPSIVVNETSFNERIRASTFNGCLQRHLEEDTQMTCFLKVPK